MTSAPKSDSTVAAAGAAMKLAQSRTLRPSKMPFSSMLASLPSARVGFVRTVDFHLFESHLTHLGQAMQRPPLHPSPWGGGGQSVSVAKDVTGGGLPPRVRCLFGALP